MLKSGKKLCFHPILSTSGGKRGVSNAGGRRAGVYFYTKLREFSAPLKLG
jgi:hypothetical protein